jgi:hypothetical protein
MGLTELMHSRHTIQVNELTSNIRGLHVYDSMVFIDKLKTKPMEQYKKGDAWIPYNEDGRRMLSPADKH